MSIGVFGGHHQGQRSLMVLHDSGQRAMVTRRVQRCARGIEVSWRIVEVGAWCEIGTNLPMAQGLVSLVGTVRRPAR